MDRLDLAQRPLLLLVALSPLIPAVPLFLAGRWAHRRAHQASHFLDWDRWSTLATVCRCGAWIGAGASGLMVYAVLRG